MKNVKNDFKIEKYLVNDEIDPKLKGLVMDVIGTDKTNFKIGDNLADGQIDPKLKALMGEINIDTKEIDSAIRQIDRKKLADQLSSMGKTKPEKLKL